MGNVLAKAYPDQTLIWTPSDNPTLKNKEKSHNLFPEEDKVRQINLIVESRDDNNIISL